MSDVTAYAIAPAVNIGLVLAGTLATPSTAGLIDDVVPIAEAMVVTEWVTRGLKLGVARERPYAHFTNATGSDDNLSFPSGHTSRAFALVTSAGVIAHARGYKSEPYIWAAGMTIGATAAYLRIAADRHYFSDVTVGAAIGVSAGLTVPLLMRRTNASVVPTRGGVALLGVW
jgi:membrane-associated phospholipid phosphatase